MVVGPVTVTGTDTVRTTVPTDVSLTVVATTTVLPGSCVV